ncbi:MAG TPA: glycosyltransferase family 39 protein, partial [Terriglobales bacterium]|nr:glycosyltransferase family 39 protein [Terriglobales bacterium]
MKKEMDETSATSGTRIDPALNVGIRVREQRAAAASEHEVTVLAAAQGWVARLTVLAAVLAVAGVYVGLHLGSGWVPADDGTLAQSALRVMQGQLPHRDFTEIYTGGLSLIHALAFRAFGVSLMSLRICAFLFFLAWIPAVYCVALRFTSAITAGLITLLAVAWSYPNYPAAMPSWYNLFFATFGAAALLRYLDVRKARWLFFAGLCGGVSILIKVIGAYYIAGVLLFLAFLEQSEGQSDELRDPEAAQTGKAAISYRVFSTSALLLFMATVIYVFRARLETGEIYHFLMPAGVLVALILAGERSVRQAATGERFGRMLRLALPFICGLISPVIAFLVPYARSGAVGKFFSGVTSSAISRSVGLGVMRPVPIEKAIFALVLVGLIAAAMYRREFQSTLVSAAVGLGLAVMLVKS